MTHPNWSTLDNPAGGPALASTPASPAALAGNPLAGRDLLRLLDLTPSELHLVLSTALAQKTAWKAGVHEAPYAGKAAAIIMEKPSLRTRISFEVGAARLGMHPAVMSDSNSAFSRGETIHDTMRVLERFVDIVVLRTFAQSKIEEVAAEASVPVINALTDDYHPCQVLADLLTMYEHQGDLSAIKLAYVGDGNNMAHTYLEGAALTGMACHVATPQGFECNPTIVASCKQAAEKTGAQLTVDHSFEDALRDATVVITDTWASMGEEAEHDARVAKFQGWQVNEAAMQLAAPNAIFMHCLPAHRGEEVNDAVMDGTQSAIYDEAENRLHAQKALMSLLLAEK
jgi:ornithine carbamoyltransferase